MEKVQDYRPDEINFIAESAKVPHVLGQFETAEEAREFMAKNLLAIQCKLRAPRLMDDFEREQIRDNYAVELEQVLPELRLQHFGSARELERAKQNEKDAKEMVNASLNKIQQLADEVNDGTTDIELLPEDTWQVPYDGKRYYYAFIDAEIKLAKVEDISSYESDDLISSSTKNAEFFSERPVAVNE